MSTAQFRPLLKPRDAAKALAVSVSTLRRLVADGRLAPPVRLSERCTAFRPEDLDRFCDASRKTSRRGS